MPIQVKFGARSAGVLLNVWEQHFFFTLFILIVMSQCTRANGPAQK